MWGWRTGKTTSGIISSEQTFHKSEWSTSKAGEKVLHLLHTHQAYRISHAAGTCLEVLGFIRILNTHQYQVLSHCFQNTRRKPIPYSFSSCSWSGAMLGLNALLPQPKQVKISHISPALHRVLRMSSDASWTSEITGSRNKTACLVGK